jgi:hypothetical protein
MSTNDQETILVAIYTDGMGTFQAQCLGCSWRGPWRRKESSAVESGKSHTEHVGVRSAQNNVLQ